MLAPTTLRSNLHQVCQGNVKTLLDYSKKVSVKSTNSSPKHDNWILFLQNKGEREKKGDGEEKDEGEKRGGGGEGERRGGREEETFCSYINVPRTQFSSAS